jgi:hypothetical protein
VEVARDVFRDGPSSQALRCACSVDRDVSHVTLPDTNSASPASPAPISVLQRPVSLAIAAASLATPLRLTVSLVLLQTV